MFYTFLQQTIPSYLAGPAWLAWGFCFAGGILTSLGPCTLSMLPVVLGYLGGYSKSGQPAFLNPLAMLLGLSLTLSLLGVAAALLGRIFGRIGPAWHFLLAALAIIMGLHLLGVLQVKLPGLVRLPVRGGTLPGSFLVGALFGLVASPCSTPVLAALLAFVAESANPLYGGSLFFAYALGQGLPLFLAGTFASFLKSWRRLLRYSRYFNYASGLLMLGLGLYLLKGAIG